MENLCDYRIIMEYKGEKAIRAMFFYECEMHEYFDKENMAEAKEAHYEKQKLNRYTNKWNKIY